MSQKILKENYYLSYIYQLDRLEDGHMPVVTTGKW